MKKSFFFLNVVAFLMLGISLASAAATTLTTYYPAPDGNYDQLTANNVGIGTSHQPNQLNIIGQSNQEFALTDYGSGTLLRMYSSGGTLAAPSAVVSAQVLGGLSLVGNNGSGWVRGARIVSQTTEPWTAATNGAYLAFETSPSGSPSAASLERMRIDKNGNVGIGITTPTAPLEVSTPNLQSYFDYSVVSGGITYYYSLASNGTLQAVTTAATGGANNWAGVFENQGGPLGLLASNNQADPSGSPIATYLDYSAGGINYGLYSNGYINLVNQNGAPGPTEGLSIDQNQIWKSITRLNPNLYLQTSNPGGAVVIGGSPSENNNLDVDGDVDIYNTAGGQSLLFDSNQIWQTGSALYLQNATGGTVEVGGLTHTNQFIVDGTENVTGSITGGAFFYTSDQRLKQNILPITGALDKVQQLNGITFQWKKGGIKDIGVTAQNVEKVLPEIVKTDKNGMKSVEYGNMVALFIEAIKEQQKEIKSQQKEIDDLEKKLGGSK